MERTYPSLPNISSVPDAQIGNVLTRKYVCMWKRGRDAVAYENRRIFQRRPTFTKLCWCFYIDRLPCLTHKHALHETDETEYAANKFSNSLNNNENSKSIFHLDDDPKARTTEWASSVLIIPVRVALLERMMERARCTRFFQPSAYRQLLTRHLVALYILAPDGTS